MKAESILSHSHHSLPQNHVIIRH